MKIKYTYMVYKDFPEATAISESRERFSVFAIMGLLLGILLSLICGFTLAKTLPEWVGTILISAILGLLLRYMLNEYPKRTEQLIQKAIQEEIYRRENWEKIKFDCKRINIFEDAQKDGICFTCYQKRPLTRCKVKQDLGTRDIYICRECMEKFKSSADRISKS